MPPCSVTLGPHHPSLVMAMVEGVAAARSTEDAVQVAAFPSLASCAVIVTGADCGAQPCTARAAAATTIKVLYKGWLLGRLLACCCHNMAVTPSRHGRALAGAGVSRRPKRNWIAARKASPGRRTVEGKCG